MAKAFYIARTGRPGPVLIDITKDAQFETFDYSYEKCSGIRSYTPITTLSNKEVEKAVEMINKSEKPLVVWGQGVILGNAEEELKIFLEKSGIPAAWTILGLSAISTDHPLNRGMVGMHGNYAPNILTNECDLLIAIGMRFDDRVTGDLKTYAKQAKIIHLELDPAEVNKNVHVDLALISDCKISLKELINNIETKTYPDWIKRFDELDKIEYEEALTEDVQTSFKFDITKDLYFNDNPAIVKFGAKSSQRKKSQQLQAYEFEDFTDNGFTDDQITMDKFTSGSVDYNLGNFGPNIDPASIQNVISQLDKSNFINEEDSAIEDYEIEEDINAAYLMGRIDLEDTRILAGVRYEGTKQTFEGY